jgi:putative addiction module CopG family antidote
MSFALPESMRSYIDERARAGGYGSTSEYLRDLIRRDQQAVEARCFRMLIADGLESGTGVRGRRRIACAGARPNRVTGIRLRLLTEADLAE